MNILVINLGLKSIRTIIFDPAGRQLFGASRPVHTAIMGEQAEQDANEWPVLLQACLETIRSESTLITSVRYVTVTTSSSCSLVLDANFKPATPVYIVSDGRAHAEAEALDKSAAFRQANQSCAASSPLAKFRWLKRAEPETAKQVSYWANAGDYLVALLTGRLVTDNLNAQKCHYREKGYDESILEVAGLSQPMLPEVVKIGTKLPLEDGFVRQNGFPARSELIVTSYDAICAVLGSTDGAATTACDVSGTVTSVRVLAREPRVVKSPLMSQSIGGDGISLVGCSNNLGGGIIEWYKQFLRMESSGDVYAQLEAEATLSSAGAQGVVFLPYLLGERAPFYKPNARATFFGLSRQTTPADLTRAVCESAAFVTRDLIGEIQSQGIEVHTLSVSGGLARLGLINQIKADVSGLPVHVPENFESTAVGAFLLVAVAVGIFPDLRVAARVIKFRYIIQPNPEYHALYEKAFALFKEINRGLGPSYELHAEHRRLSSSYRKATLSNL